MKVYSSPAGKGLVPFFSLWLDRGSRSAGDRLGSMFPSNTVGEGCI